MKLQLLAFAAHPDDVELSCSGTLIKHIKNGDKVGIIDLTKGELGTRGTEHTRKEEAKTASKIIGLSIRENLEIPDGFISDEKTNLLKVIKSIRKYRPEIVLCNAIKDRHPDHGIASKLVSRACFLSGLLKINTPKLEPWRPKIVLHYIQDRYIKPDIVIDVTAEFEQKLEAIKAYKTQFFLGIQDNLPQTPISSENFIEHIIGRSANYGREIGVKHGEGFTSERTLGINTLNELE